MARRARATSETDRESYNRSSRVSFLRFQSRAPPGKIHAVDTPGHAPSRLGSIQLFEEVIERKHVM